MATKEPKSKGPKKKLGELLLENNVITPEQMDAALKRQAMMGGRLGQNLIQLGFLHEDSLISFLASQGKIVPIDLRKITIPRDVQILIPLEKMRRLGVIPLEESRGSLRVGMTDPTDVHAIQELEFSLGLKVTPVAIPESQWNRAIAFFTQKGLGVAPFVGSDDRREVPRSDYLLPDLMRQLIELGGSDIHLTVGAPPTFRVHNALQRLDLPALTPEKVSGLVHEVLTPKQREMLSVRMELDLAIDFKGIGRFRVNLFHQKGHLAAALRLVADKIPSLKELNLPPWIAEFAEKKQGLILITGPSGHGKSTTMACLIDIINSTRRVNIVTLEDPIEYIHYHKTSNINQRELGTDTASFSDGIRYIFRQDPDVISIGEMRDLESISTALTAAETGHLVLATLHTLNATSTIDRIIDVFPGDQQNQVRHQLADTLLMIISQRLIPKADRSGRTLAHEKLTNSYRIQAAIRDKRVHMVRSQYMGSQDDFMPMEVNLAYLCRRGVISFEEGRKFAEDPKVFDLIIKK